MAGAQPPVNKRIAHRDFREKGNQFNAFSRKRKITERKIAVPALGGAAAAPKQGKAHGRAHGPTQGGNAKKTIYTCIYV